MHVLYHIPLDIAIIRYISGLRQRYSIASETGGSPEKSPRTRTRTWVRVMPAARFAEEVVGDAAGHGEIEELASVEAQSTAAGLDWAVDDERKRACAADCRHVSGDIPRFGLEHDVLRQPS
jgi:hypothetical protein